MDHSLVCLLQVMIFIFVDRSVLATRGRDISCSVPPFVDKTFASALLEKDALLKEVCLEENDKSPRQLQYPASGMSSDFGVQQEKLRTSKGDNLQRVTLPTTKHGPKKQGNSKKLKGSKKQRKKKKKKKSIVKKTRKS